MIECTVYERSTWYISWWYYEALVKQNVENGQFHLHTCFSHVHANTHTKAYPTSTHIHKESNTIDDTCLYLGHTHRDTHFMKQLYHVHANAQKQCVACTCFCLVFITNKTTDKVNTRWPLTLLYLPKMYLPTGDRAVIAAHNTNEPTNTRWPSILCGPSVIEWDFRITWDQGCRSHYNWRGDHKYGVNMEDFLERTPITSPTAQMNWCNRCRLFKVPYNIYESLLCNHYTYFQRQTSTNGASFTLWEEVWR